MFHSARIKLTAWYLVILMIICVMFSAFIYGVHVNEIERFSRQQIERMERAKSGEVCWSSSGLDSRPTPMPIPLGVIEEFVTEAKHRVFNLLLVVNVMIFIIAGAFSYVLAGVTLAPIKKMVEEQNRFISDASHELKTPLTALKTAFEVYLRNKNRQLSEADEVITESLTDVDKLQRLSESLLELAQYQQPNNHVAHAVLELSPLIRAAIRKVQPLAQARNLQILFQTQNVQIRGNSEALIDLWVILLDNAIKYSYPNNKIEVRVKREGKNSIVEIRDYGVGISKKDLPFIFDRFFRANEARSEESHGGYGLGLAIAEKIVTTHHGQIEVTSQIKKGTHFFVTLPLAA